MKINGRTILKRLYGIKRFGNRLSRFRHFRGHGVHSPFVYSIVREVFMHPEVDVDDKLFLTMVDAEIPYKRAVQLRKLVEHCNYSRVGIDCEVDGYDFVVFTADFPTERLADVVSNARNCGTTLVIMAPYANSGRDKVCRMIVETHRSTTIDNRGYLLVFNNHLPKQHFKL